MISSFKRLVAVLTLAVPVVALVASPAMATSRHRHHHTSVHKASLHRSHSHKAATPTAS